MDIEFPKTLGAAVDMLYEQRAKRLALSKDAKEVEEVESALKQYIIQKLTSEDQDSSRGKVATATITRSREAILDDPAAFHEFVKKTDGWDMVQNRVSITAIRARWDNDEAVPGISMYIKEDLSLTKAGAKRVK